MLCYFIPFSHLILNQYITDLIFTMKNLKNFMIIKNCSFLCYLSFSCPYLHRNIGDTEKRYHLRYFKTEMCAGEMDSRGNCSKNGPHCAFAHGTDDLRLPVCDAVEMQGARINGDSHTNCFDNLVDKEPKAVLHIDSCWNGE